MAPTEWLQHDELTWSLKGIGFIILRARGYNTYLLNREAPFRPFDTLEEAKQAAIQGSDRRPT